MRNKFTFLAFRIHFSARQCQSVQVVTGHIGGSSCNAAEGLWKDPQFILRSRTLQDLVAERIYQRHRYILLIHVYLKNETFSHFCLFQNNISFQSQIVQSEVPQMGWTSVYIILYSLLAIILLFIAFYNCLLQKDERSNWNICETIWFLCGKMTLL